MINFSDIERELKVRMIERSSQSNTFIISKDLFFTVKRTHSIYKRLSKFGLSEIIIEHNSKKAQSDLLITCDCFCGMRFTKKFSAMSASPNCGCAKYQYVKGSNNYQFTGIGELSGKKWSGIKMNANIRSIEFNVDLNYVYSIFLKQSELCIYTGRKLNSTNMSLDRIDSKLGYVENNIQWVHKDINIMKWDLTTKQFLSWCKRIANPIKSNRTYTKINVPKFIIWNRSYVGNLSKTYFTKIYKGAKSRDINFEIDMQQMWDKFVEQGGKCAITGIRLNFNSVRQSASLDRIDSKKPYTIDNIQWVHKVINSKIKQTFSQEYLIKTCKEIYENCKNRTN